MLPLVLDTWVNWTDIFFFEQHKLLHVNEKLKVTLERLTKKVQELALIVEGKATLEDQR